MKKIVVILILISAVAFYINADEEISENKKNGYKTYADNAFSYYLGEQVIDMVSGNSLLAPGALDNLNNKKNVISMNTIRTIITKVNGSAYSAGTTLEKNYTFENGLLTSIYDSASDIEPLTNIVYDHSGRLISYGDTVFQYLGQNDLAIKTREISYPYWSSNREQQVRALENGFEVTTDAGSNIYTYQYMYEKDLLLEYIKFTGIDKKESSRVTFTYENNLPTKIVLTYPRKDRSSYVEEITLTYKNSNIVRKDIVRFRIAGKEYETRLFSNYDAYGNWQDMELYRNDVLIETYHRDILYLKGKG